MLVHWIWFSIRQNISDRMKVELLRHFRDPEDIFYAGKEAFRGLEGLTEEGFAIDRTLHALPEMTAEQPLLTGVVFPGDMTTYGLHFRDGSGARRFFAVSISGRNGMLILEEWPVAEAP